MILPPDAIGERLDAALKWLFPKSGLRARRRMILDGAILVNGKAASSHYRLKPSDRVEALERQPKPQDATPFYLSGQNDFKIFYKPPGWHTEKLAGRSDDSLDDWIQGNLAPPLPALLQRLDFWTDGLICGTANEQKARAFREAENAGRCDKFYLALLSGYLSDQIIVKNALDTSHKKVKALPKDAPPLLWTELTPLRQLTRFKSFQNCTLTLCKIKKGQRHQIRAHAAAVGHALAGDEVYGEGGGYFLTHFCIKSPLLDYSWLPPDFWGKRFLDLLPGNWRARSLKPVSAMC